MYILEKELNEIKFYWTGKLWLNKRKAAKRFRDKYTANVAKNKLKKAEEITITQWNK